MNNNSKYLTSFVYSDAIRPQHYGGIITFMLCDVNATNKTPPPPDIYSRNSLYQTPNN